MGSQSLNSGAGAAANYSLFPTIYDAMRNSRHAYAVHEALISRIQDDQTSELLPREFERLEQGWHQRLVQIYKSRK